MGRYPEETLSAPLAMATATVEIELSRTRCRELVGFFGARNGRCQTSYPLQRILQTNKNGVTTGLAYYFAPQPPTQADFDAGLFRYDRLLVVKNGTSVYAHNLTFDASRIEITFGDPVYVGELQSVETGGLAENQNVRSVQYQNELFMVAGDGSTPMRFFLDGDDLEPHLYAVGISQPAALVGPELRNTVYPGAASYSWYVTDADEKGRESSPSDAVTATGVAAVDNSHTEALSSPWPSDPQVVKKHFYRTTDGAPQIAYRLGTVDRDSGAEADFVDFFLDSEITSNEQMPPAGSCEPPKRASCIELHKSRLMMNNRNIYDDSTDSASLSQLQMSNLDNPTQYNLDPTNAAISEVYGIQMDIGNRNAEEINGLASDGSLLAILSPAGVHHLFEDSPADFVIRHQHNIGNMSIDSVVVNGSEFFYLGPSGPVMTRFADGFVPIQLGTEIDDRFRGTVIVTRA